MNKFPRALSRPFCLLLLVLASGSTHAARVTLITHGFNASVDEWIVPMANRMAGYTSFHGADASIYQLTVATNAGGMGRTAGQDQQEQAKWPA
jgi:hypothetical protein